MIVSEVSKYVSDFLKCPKTLQICLWTFKMEFEKNSKNQIFDHFWLPQECTFFLKKTPFLRKSQISPISQFSRRDIFQKTGASTINPFVQHVYRSYSPQNKILEVYASYCGTCALFTEKKTVSPHVYTTLKNLPIWKKLDTTISHRKLGTCGFSCWNNLCQNFQM